jgi:hypothetical protein
MIVLGQIPRAAVVLLIKGLKLRPLEPERRGATSVADEWWHRSMGGLFVPEDRLA